MLDDIEFSDCRIIDNPDHRFYREAWGEGRCAIQFTAIIFSFRLRWREDLKFLLIDHFNEDVPLFEPLKAIENTSYNDLVYWINRLSNLKVFL
jgi:hypothetical protein